MLGAAAAAPAHSAIDKHIVQWDSFGMPLSVSFAEGRGEHARRLRRTIIAVFAICAALFVANVAGRAMVETFAHDDFPEQLAVKVEQLPIIFPIHMLAGALALVLIPLAIAVRRWPRWHRPIAYLAATDVLVAGSPPSRSPGPPPSPPGPPPASAPRRSCG